MSQGGVITMPFDSAQPPPLHRLPPSRLHSEPRAQLVFFFLWSQIPKQQVSTGCVSPPPSVTPPLDLKNADCSTPDCRRSASRWVLPHYGSEWERILTAIAIFLSLSLSPCELTTRCSRALELNGLLGFNAFRIRVIIRSSVFQNETKAKITKQQLVFFICFDTNWTITQYPICQFFNWVQTWESEKQGTVPFFWLGMNDKYRCNVNPTTWTCSIYYIKVWPVLNINQYWIE